MRVVYVLPVNVTIEKVVRVSGFPKYIPSAISTAGTLVFRSYGRGYCRNRNFDDITFSLLQCTIIAFTEFRLNVSFQYKIHDLENFTSISVILKIEIRGSSVRL